MAIDFGALHFRDYAVFGTGQGYIALNGPSVQSGVLLDSHDSCSTNRWQLWLGGFCMVLFFAPVTSVPGLRSFAHGHSYPGDLLDDLPDVLL